MLLLGRKAITNLDSIFKSRDITLPTKVRLVKAMVFAVVMYGNESWTIKLSTKELMLLNCGVGEDSWRDLDCKEIQPVHPKGNQSWIFTARTDAEAETPILWPPDAKIWLTGRPWRWERLKGGEGDREWDGWMASPTQWTWTWETPGVDDGQGGLACSSPWGRWESDTTERLN